MRLTQRDHEILRWVNRFGGVTQAQIARDWFGEQGTEDGMPAARRRIRLLRRAGLLVTHRLLWRVSPLVTCTRTGASAAASSLKPYSPRLFDLQHNLQVVDIASALLRSHPAGTWRTEKELRAGGFRVATYLSDYAHLPDGIYEAPGGAQVAVEFDRTPKSSARYGRLVSDYLDAVAQGSLTSVLFVVANGGLAARIRKAITEERAADVAAVVVWAGGTFDC